MAGSAPLSSTVVLVTREGLGSGEVELQRALMAKYLGVLLAGDLVPASVCFYTEGVRLVVEGSPVLDPLRALQRKGCKLLVCSTCLDFFDLKDLVRVGSVCGMPEIVNAQVQAGKVISV